MKEATVPTRHVLPLPVFGAYSSQLDPLFYVRFETHAYRGVDATLRPLVRLLGKTECRSNYVSMSLAFTAGLAMPKR